MLDVRRLAWGRPLATRMTLQWFTTRRIVLIALAVVFSGPLLSIAIVIFVAQPVRNQGTGMLPSLRDGDRLMINKMTRTFDRGEVVVFRFPRDVAKSMIKRLVAKDGDTIEIRGGAVYLNGSPLNEPYVDPEFNQSSRDYGPEVVPPGHVFVLGDNRDHSNDSRYWGMLPAHLIYGRVWFHYG